jgi:hypothetical protein
MAKLLARSPIKIPERTPAASTPPTRKIIAEVITVLTKIGTTARECQRSVALPDPDA